MARYPKYSGNFRHRDVNSIELAIHHKLVPAFEFRKIKSGNPPKTKVLDRNGNPAVLYIWINKKNNIEIIDASRGLNSVVGVFFERNVRSHGGSYVFTIHFSVIKSLRKRSITLNKTNFILKKPGHVELQLLPNL